MKEQIDAKLANGLLLILQNAGEFDEKYIVNHADVANYCMMYYAERFISTIVSDDNLSKIELTNMLNFIYGAFDSNLEPFYCAIELCGEYKNLPLLEEFTKTRHSKGSD